MFSRNIFLIFLFSLILVSIASVSAADIDNLYNESTQTVLSEEIAIGVDNEKVSNSESSLVIGTDNPDESFEVYYVGANDDESGGDGSFENPYADLEFACKGCSGKENVTLKIFEGTYEIGKQSDLTFNTKNLNIESYNGSVLFKNKYAVENYDEGPSNFEMGIKLGQTSSTIKLDNITVDVTGIEQVDDFCDGFFYLVAGISDTIIFNDCVFKGFDSTSSPEGAYIIGVVKAGQSSEYKFNRCVFKDYKAYMFANPSSTIVSFESCIFSNVTFSNRFGFSGAVNLSINGVWFGENNPTIFNDVSGYHNPPKVNYAFFKISENYLGDNKYEIIGTMVYQDTNDIIEDMPAMTVTLSSTTGTLESETATLENGTFKVLYTSSESTHTVTATLDSASVPLTFATIDLEASANPIAYGEDQNITITLPEAMDGNITIIINNKTYTYEIFSEKDIVYQIPDILKSGNYTVNVTFVDESDYYHGSAVCYLNISQISDYQFNATVPATVTVGETADITINLPGDVNGTASVKVGENSAVDTNVSAAATSLTIGGFVSGDNIVYITFNGDDKYASRTINYTVTASTISSKLTANNVSTTYNDTKYLVVSLSDGDGNVLANKTVSIVVGTVDVNLTTNDNGQVSVDVSALTPSSYVAVISFAGDTIYDACDVNASVVVSKVSTSISAPAVSTTYSVGENLLVSLSDGDGNVLAGKTVSIVVGTVDVNLTTNDSGQVSVDVSALTPSSYVAVISFAGDTIYDACDVNASVVVSKVSTSISAPAVSTTYNVAKNLVVTLKDANGNAFANQSVTVKVGSISKTLTTDANGQVSVDVSALTPNTYTATFTYSGDNTTSESTNTAKVVVSKAKPTLTAKKATFKAKKKTKKYSVTLKDNKGKAISKAKITLKVKGKTYKATTNAKGKATLKIKKLTKKGNYKATIKFAGNSFYSAVSKKTKITIKK